jgi:hypothetical protein
MDIGAFIAVWVLVLLANLAFWAGVIYVALHFISKYW